MDHGALRLHVIRSFPGEKLNTVMGRRAVLGAAGGLLAAPAIVRAEATGVALVVGNSRYRWEAQLANVKRDAPDVAKALQARGLKTELIQDVPRADFEQAIGRFKSVSSGANVAAFYYAGHGASWDNETYLVPVDADLANPGVVKTLLPVSSVTSAMKGAVNRLLVFDNCRNNPADGWRQLAAVRSATSETAKNAVSASQPVPDTLTLYSTAPGRVALDGPPGENSPFAAALLRHLGGGPVDLQALPAGLRRDLLLMTEGRQVLWDENTYRQPFILGEPRQGASRPSPVRAPAGVIELTNAYAFAREHDLPMPEGLVAFRPRPGAPDASKAGAFTFTAASSGGQDQRLLLVLSIDEQRTAEVVVAGKSSSGRYWRFVTAKCATNTLDLVSRDEGASYLFEWKDADSGSVAQLKETGRNKGAKSVRFNRLDG
jgi:hypothetical protein